MARVFDYLRLYKCEYTIISDLSTNGDQRHHDFFQASSFVFVVQFSHLTYCTLENFSRVDHYLDTKMIRASRFQTSCDYVLTGFIVS